jgi:hypothetical protein
MFIGTETGYPDIIIAAIMAALVTRSVRVQP